MLQLNEHMDILLSLELKKKMFLFVFMIQVIIVFLLVFMMQLKVKMTGNLFEVELPNGEEIQFPKREGLDVISYVRVKGDFKLTSFKIY